MWKLRAVDVRNGRPANWALLPSEEWDSYDLAAEMCHNLNVRDAEKDLVWIIEPEMEI